MSYFAKSTQAILAVAALAAVLLVSGCGGDGGGEGQTALTRVEFIKQADAICAKADKAQEARLQDYSRENPDGQSTKKGQIEAITEAGLPPLAVEAEELAALEAPEGDEEKIAAIVEGIEGAVKKSEANPASLMGEGPSPFLAVDKLTAAYGFKECNNAL